MYVSCINLIRFMYFVVVVVLFLKDGVQELLDVWLVKDR
jgi:hypothetical protein